MRQGMISDRSIRQVKRIRVRSQTVVRFPTRMAINSGYYKEIFYEPV